MISLQQVSAATVSLALSYVAWSVIPNLSESSVQAIGTTISTVAGILFGFVLASMSVIVSAGDNTLVRNTNLTGYLPRLMCRLQLTMALLLAVCLIFLAVLFVPHDSQLPVLESIRLAPVVVLLGVFLFSYSVMIFVFVAKEFRNFAVLL